MRKRKKEEKKLKIKNGKKTKIFKKYLFMQFNY
jgi:hypothetical protein